MTSSYWRRIARLSSVTALLVVMFAELSGCREMDLLQVVRARVADTSVAIYVSVDGDDDNTGLQPDRPVQHLDRAMEIAATQAPAEIRVAEGTYQLGDEGPIELVSGVSLLGGYNRGFSDRSAEDHTSVIRSGSAGLSGLIRARGSEISGGSIEGFTFQREVSGNLSGEAWFSGVEVADGASVNIRDNSFRFTVEVSGEVDTMISAIEVSTWEGDPATYPVEISGNDIHVVLDREFPGTWPQAAGIMLHGIGPGSELNISSNRIAMVNASDERASGIELYGDCSGVAIYNNTISVTGEGSARGISAEGGNTEAAILNNTIIVHDAAGSGAAAIELRQFPEDSFSASLQIRNNILGTVDGGTCVVNQREGTCNYGYNLCFNAAELSGNITSTGSNTHVDRDIFSEVFTSGYNADLYAGDQNDYHLDDTSMGGPYAVDQGSLDATEDTATDFEGDERPHGAAVDRGADEAQASVGWIVEEVPLASDVSPDQLSVAFDQYDRPHVAYEDDSVRSIDRTWWDGSAWKHETIASLSYEHFGNPSIGVASNGSLYVSYNDSQDYGSTITLELAMNDGDTWETQSVDSSTGSGSSLVLDDDGNPHISYVAGDPVSDATLKCAHWSGSTWQIDTVDPTQGVKRGSIARDPETGGLHISYVHGSSNNDLKYAHWNGTSWSNTTVDSGTSVSGASSIAIDIDGAPHIAYPDADNDEVEYTWWDGEKWMFQTVDTVDSLSTYNLAIAVAAEGIVRIGYVIALGHGQVLCATHSPPVGPDWEIEEIWHSGHGQSIAVNSTGAPHIAYVWEDASGDGLGYARIGVTHE